MMSNTSIYDMLWDDSIWFPVRFHHEDGSVDTALGWSQLVNKPGTNTYYPKVHDLHFGILVGVVLVIIRYVVETLLILPLGYKLGIKKKKLVYVDAIPSLEAVYKTKKKPDDKQCMGLSKQLDMPLRQVQVWFRNKRNNDLTPPIKKFCDNAWSFLFYTCSFIYGATILWNKSWIWRTKDCWTNWPKQHVTSDLYWYYTVELGFYCSLLFTIFTDHKRKGLSKQLDMPLRQVQVWFRNKRNNDLTPPIKKFCDNAKAPVTQHEACGNKEAGSNAVSVNVADKYKLSLFERPLPLIVKTDAGEGNTLSYNHDTFERTLSQIEEPLCVIAVAGCLRTGKSYLLSRLVQKCGVSGECFNVGHSVNAHTQGIWIMCRPHPTQEGKVIVFLDTEGR
ncbi:ceramide synthase 5-like [Mya arenaria]|uniref:ceramide synthase 5-like n=1 Tax=Mya arenaria TaxID=6604 RepID=UPI0022E77B4F|nr:ceramide synthase 5-like [Mya arenaria]XP_052803729.1 ceramide synthase 5-like [Mya arenaria]XP_052803735.1 ceramide synthase 5-like [Mya arenaria]